MARDGFVKLALAWLLAICSGELLKKFIGLRPFCENKCLSYYYAIKSRLVDSHLSWPTVVCQVTPTFFAPDMTRVAQRTVSAQV